jgi:serine/threonine protein kinase
VPSPIKLARKTSQSLRGLLKHENFQAGQAWVQELVFLSATTNVGVQGPASRDRVHTRRTVLAAIQDTELVKRTSSRAVLASTVPAEADLLRLLTGEKRGPRPVRRVREYEVVERVDHQDTFSEVIGRNALSHEKRLLRIYSIPPLATDEQRKRIQERARWEAQVLGRLGRCPGILTADSPFTDEAGIVIPFEHFEGITLATWLERYGPLSKEKPADLEVRTDLWKRIAEAVDEAHRQGVVHRLLRPEVILVEDSLKPEQVRVTGFELAKMLTSDGTIALSTTMGHERFRFAAPEVATSFSSAEPASDQFGLGVLLALLLTGRPLFDSTRALMAAQRLMSRVRDHARNVPLTLDEAVSRMLALRPTERFPSIRDAVDTVMRGRDPAARVVPLPLVLTAALDPDNLAKGTRIGRDYEIEGRLGQGGMAVVYAARHLVSDRVRALKVARPELSAQEALRGEYAALDALDHPNIVRVVDINFVVGDRLTLVMERVSGTNLRHWLRDHPTPEPQTQRRFAEDLLNGLEYLEQKGVLHKDLKPDNLLVGDRLTIIDFSLASAPEEAPYGGTALYRDPASVRWTPGTDRYAAGLCLFELYAGRHAFDGRVPEPGEAPAVTDQDIDPPGLAAFFRKALNPTSEQRFASANAMRSALLLAIGSEVDPEVVAPAVGQIDAGTPLQLCGLSRRAVNLLRQSRLNTVGDLLQLPETQVRAIHSIGKKTADELLGFQAAARARGLGPSSTPANLDPLLAPDLADSPEPVERLALVSSTLRTLRDANLPTVGAVASLTQRALLATKGVGRGTMAQIVSALHGFRDRTPGSASVTTLDSIWELVSRPLTPAQRLAVERVVGILSEPETQGDIAADLGKSQPSVSVSCTEGLTRLDMGALADPLTGLEMLLDGVGGITSLADAASRFEETWPPGVVRGDGLIRLLARVSTGRFHLVEIDGVEQPILAWPAFDRATLRGFAAEALRLASQWPPVDPVSARRAISALLPGYERDALGLAVHLCDDIETTDTGHLFIGPLDPKLTISFVLERERDALTFGDLEARVRRVFGEPCAFPDADHLLELLRDLDVQVQGDRIVPGRSHSVVAPVPLAADALPQVLAAERSPEVAVRDLLRDAAKSRGFRMLVTPPERHAEIGPTVARSLGARWVSFEGAFFTKYGADLARLERAERFAAQRDDLSEAAEELLFELLDEHGRAGESVVLGDTALLGLCGALDLPRRLYDETLSGERGFWVLVLPGVIHSRQPRFNEREPMWQLQGATLPLSTLLPL